MFESNLLAAPPFVPPENANVTLATHRSIASIAAFKGCLTPLQDALGLTLPGPGKHVQQDGIHYLWSGPETWLAITSADPDFDIKLAQRCNGLAAITDQSDGRCILRISGLAARDTLAKLLPIDLHPSVFASDATAMTLAHHISIQIWRDEDAFELACFRSFAETLYEALSKASRF